MFTDIVTEFGNLFESKVFAKRTGKKPLKNNRFVTGIMIVKIFMFNIFVIMFNVLYVLSFVHYIASELVSCVD